MSTSTNVSTFDQMHIDLKSLEREQARLQFLFDSACTYLKFDQKEFFKTLGDLDVIDASAWKQIFDWFNALQDGLLPGKRTFKAEDIENTFYDIGLGSEQITKLIYALYFSNQWPEVCYQYARDYGVNPVGELGEIVKDFEQMADHTYVL